MAVHVAMMLLCLLPTDPLAAFKANFARCRVSVDYWYESWTASPHIVGRLRRGQAIEIDPTSNVGAVGTWAFDGTTQYIDFGEPGAGYELRSIPSVEGGHGSFAPRRRESLFDGATTAEVQIAPRRRESLFDGTTTAEVQFDPPIYVIRAQNNRPGQFGAWGYGSFSPYGSAILNTLEQKQDRPDSRPFVSRIVRNGRVLDVAFYDRNADFRTRERFEVDYDAAAGFLPHYSRSISTTPEETSVSETFLIRTQAVPGGGVVPMEWFETGFMLHEAPRQANEYDVGTEVRPSGSVWLTHFIAWDVRPQTEPVALKHVDGVQALSLPRGRVPFDPGAGAVTMARIKEAAGVKLEWPDLDRSAPLDPTFVDRPFGGVPEEFPSWEAYLGQPAEDSWAPFAIFAAIVAFVGAIAALCARRKIMSRNETPTRGRVTPLDPDEPDASESRVD